MPPSSAAAKAAAADGDADATPFKAHWYCRMGPGQQQQKDRGWNHMTRGWLGEWRVNVLWSPHKLM
jgi:hypothetical protein